MERTAITEQAERILQDAASTIMTPTAGECLVCFVARQLDEFGCDNTHRFAAHYRDSLAPRATSLLSRLSEMGACCCDCEILMNAYEPARRLWTPAPVSADEDGFEADDFEADDFNEDDCDEWEGPEPPDTMPPCETTRRGSTQPCANWQRVPRPRYR